MAKKGIQLDQDELCCSICLDLLKDPVTIPCGHIYCMSCIRTYWDEEGQKENSCPQCRRTFTQRPALVKNTLLADLVEDLKRTGLQAAPAAHCYATHQDVACDSCTSRKLKTTKSCLQCLVSYCDQHLQPHYESPAFEKHQLVDPCEKLQENVCTRHNELMKVFCRTDQQCICYLCSMDEHKGHNTDVLTVEWTQLSLLEVEQEALKPRAEPRTRSEFLQYSQRMTLDPNTAHNQLKLSEGNRKATVMQQNRYSSRHPDKVILPQHVLGAERLTGRHYWEVQIEQDVFKAAVAVTYKEFFRTRESEFGYDEISWALGFCYSHYEVVHNGSILFTSSPRPSRVGVFLDHGAGTLSFYNVSDTMTLLHRVQTTFTEPLYAGFSVYGFGKSIELCELK